ncbi:hypothetical protein M378DRAFT_162066 [Amanita muscaria Koide BX008]|uniref:Uncharacterized protein n=1 Tax=Amanita muscaria (strain Koide BX008) TaxID=946122 RepID=A0A0C2TF06_AMAMK|nr:hypothetical protein M378DRAFT_162066 [Amanita muscaria Koide BX008]
MESDFTDGIVRPKGWRGHHEQCQEVDTRTDIVLLANLTQGRKLSSLTPSYRVSASRSAMTPRRISTSLCAL